MIKDVKTYKLYDTCSIVELREEALWWIVQSTIRGLSDCGEESMAVQLSYFVLLQ